ncbi:MAG: hypothetical protein ABL984_14620, partial [Pyrinomonadaceae bacterium]
KTAPRNHRQTARATPTVPSGSYEKFKSKTRPVSKLHFLLYYLRVLDADDHNLRRDISFPVM